MLLTAYLDSSLASNLASSNTEAQSKFDLHFLNVSEIEAP